jgi:hypothetical protein
MPADFGAGEERDFLALSRRAYELWNAEGVQAFAERWWSSEIVWEEPANFPEAGVRQGRQACIDRMKERFEPVGHVSVDVVSVRRVTESVFLQELTIRGRGTSSGIPTEMTDWLLGEINDDEQVIWMREFLDRDAAFADAGLSDEAA